MTKDEILQAVKDGYKEYATGDAEKAAKIWLPAWKAAQAHLILTGCKKEQNIKDAFGYNFLNWFFDLDAALMECDLQNERIDLNRYLLSIPDYMDKDNPRLNLAESLAALNRYDEAESMLSKWLEEDPFWTYGWTCLANILLDNGRKEKAHEIIDRGISTIESSAKETADLLNFYQNAEAVYKRLGEPERAEYCAKKDREQIAKAKPATSSPKQTPITVSKVGRNDPCPCGSGKKYKKCCGR
jgi:tetratricopeptide (TPR) repeat protein